LNAGVQYTAQFNKAGFVNALFGQSYQLLGQNSYAIADTVNTVFPAVLPSRDRLCGARRLSAG